MRIPLVLSILVLAAGSAFPASLEDVLRAHPADRLIEPLRELESQQPGPEGARAGFELGQLHYARGEYRAAADAFARAAARFEPARKSEARYWLGLSYVGLHEWTRARATLEELARGGGERRREALFALAGVWEAERRPDLALESLGRVLEGSPGEVTPAALERVVVVAEALGRPDLSKQARQRLLREYAGGIESARLTPPLEAPAIERSPRNTLRVVLGPFSDATRARELAGAARRSGFPTASVDRAERGVSGWIVRIGEYPSAEPAREAGERASSALGVPYRIQGTR